MYLDEATSYQIQRIMDREGLDEDEAREYLANLIDWEDVEEEDNADRCGLGDCFGDAL